MRLTNKLFAQHIGWHFKKHWQIQGKRVVRDTGTETHLQTLGISVKNPNEIIAPPTGHVIENFKFEHPLGWVPPEDQNHPNWHNQAIHTYGDNNVLLEGLPQASILTKTIEIRGFPKNIEESISRTQLPSHIDKSVQNAIMASHVFDAQQVKLPKARLPDRPHYNLPRLFGISHERKNRLLINKLLAECEKLAGYSVSSKRRMFDNANFGVTLPRNEDTLRFDVVAEKLMTSNKPIDPVKGQYDAELPDLYPLKCTITMPKKHIYTTEDFYPISDGLSCSHPHTIFLRFDKELVQNLHGSSVSNSQFHSRNMLKAFTVAAARAKQIYGASALEKIPKPIVVQSIQTDGQTFHFGVFQLNTLNIGNSDGQKNYWFHEPNMELFSLCNYKAGRPTLEGYKKDIIRCLNAFYNA